MEMLNKILIGATVGLVSVLVIMLTLSKMEANKLRDLSAKQQTVIELQTKSLISLTNQKLALEQSIARYAAATDKINQKNRRLSARIATLRSKQNVKKWIATMPDSVDQFLRKNYSRNKDRKNKNSVSVHKSNSSAVIRKARRNLRVSARLRYSAIKLQSG